MKRAIFFLFASLGYFVFAQDYIDINSPMPIDKTVKMGKLDNGLTYYIKKNGKPENKVELRLVVNAGSILETEEQRGLAHFMEHMNFNGTKNFAHNELVDYLQSIGVKFGQHLNAYTSFDETVYILPIPSEDSEKVEKGFEILEDWAFNCLLTPEEIEKERGVVLEELRLGLGAEKRMMEAYLPMIMHGSQYAERLPIGLKTVLETFDHEQLKSFYNTWYRPDLMAVVVVGDIEVEDAQKKIEAHFGNYKNPENAPARKEFFVPNHEETFVAIEKDKEASFSRVNLVYKDLNDTKPIVSVSDYRNSIVINLFNTMINNRLTEISNNPNPPFTYGYSYHGSTWARHKESFESQAMTDPNNQLRAFETLVVENERVKRHGFTRGELERAKKEVLARYESYKLNKAKTESRSYAREYIGHFLNAEVIPGIDFEYRAHEVLLNGIMLEDVNALIKNFIHDNNRVIVFTGPDGDEMPVYSREQVLAVLSDVGSRDIEPYQDADVAESFITKEPVAGTVVSNDMIESLDMHKMTLSNGVTVYYKKTDFKDNEILMRAVSMGGTSLMQSDEEYNKVKLALGGLTEAGMNGFKQNDMMKMMAGKEVSVSPFISSLYEGLRGRSVNKDIEEMFQLTYLYFTALNKDKDAYDAYVVKQSAFLGNLLNTPQYWYMNERAKISEKNNPRFTNAIPRAEEYQSQDYDMAYDFYNNRFADASDFTFIIIGSIDEDQIVELSKKYLGSLPSLDRKETWVEHRYEHLNGIHEFILNKGTDPKSMVDINYRTEAPYDAKQAYYLKSAAEILTIKLVENLREGESGVYGVGARAGASKIPYGTYNFSISFPCGPENAQNLKKAALEQLAILMENGPEEKDLAKIKEAQRLELKENMKKNNFWLNQINMAILYDKNIEDMLKAEKEIEALTAQNIKDAANAYIGENRLITILMPEE